MTRADKIRRARRLEQHMRYEAMKRERVLAERAEMQRRAILAQHVKGEAA